MFSFPTSARSHFWCLMVLSLVAWCCPAGAVSLTEAIDLVEKNGGHSSPLKNLDADHPLPKALEGKVLRKHRVIVPGADAFYFGSDDRTVVIITSRDDVLGHYVLPAVRGADFQNLSGDETPAGSVLSDAVVYTISDLGWFWLEPRITLTPALAEAVTVTGAQVDESDIQHELQVDHAGQNDPANKRFVTLGAAVKAAEQYLQQGESVKITVSSGIYREGEIEMWCKSWSEAARNAALIIEGQGDTRPVITGADDWSGGWEPVEGSDNVYRKPWPHAFGLSRQIWERWGYLIDPRVARSEVVTVDGQIMLPAMLEQFAWVDPDGAVPLEETRESANQPGKWKPLGVEPADTLLPGTFGVVESDQAIYVCPPDEVDLNQSAVEVSVRPYLITITGRNNVVLRNLSFVNSATFVGSHQQAVSLEGNNLLVEDCNFDMHGSNAFAIRGEQLANITLRRSTFNGNGWKGLAVGYRVDNYIIEDCESSYNNWRGHTGLQYGWDAAGCKAFALDGQVGMVIRGHRSFANLTSGFWFDQSFTPRSPIDVTDSYFVANQFGAQLYLEKLTGPVNIERNVIWNSDGIRGIDGTSWNVNLKNNILYTSSDGQPAIYLHRRGIESEYANYSKDWSIHHNLIVSNSDSSQLLTNDSTDSQYAEFLDTLSADHNVYYSVSRDYAFPLPTEETGGLPAWREATGEEKDSLWADPQFASAAKFDWTIQNSTVKEKLPDLPSPLSTEDREKLEYAIAQSSRFLSITAAAGHKSGPAFELSKNVIENNWEPVDISEVVNRPLVGQDAWIGAGNALPHLEAGRHVFAGVPFDIADPSGNADVSIALRSNKITETRGQELPTSIELPIDQTSPVIYILHGAGWIGDETEPAAHYELVYADGSTHGLEIKPFNAGVAQPNVGEWYHAFPIFDNDNTRHVSLKAHGQSPGATLYVSELRNPQPTKTIEKLRLRSIPQRDTSIIILGVTVLAE